MRNIVMGTLGGVGLMFLLGAFGQSQPPGGPGARPGRPEVGSVIPPFARGPLNLSEVQQQQVAEIEKDVKERLHKILTPEQLKMFEEALRKGPPGRPGGPPMGGPPMPPPPPPPPPPPEPPQAEPMAPLGNVQPTGGIQWFATLERGLAEAKRTGKPIFLVSAAPHCGGVSGIW